MRESGKGMRKQGGEALHVGACSGLCAVHADNRLGVAIFGRVTEALAGETAPRSQNNKSHSELHVASMKRRWKTGTSSSEEQVGVNQRRHIPSYPSGGKPQRRLLRLSVKERQLSPLRDAMGRGAEIPFMGARGKHEEGGKGIAAEPREPGPHK